MISIVIVLMVTGEGEREEGREGGREREGEREGGRGKDGGREG